MRNTGIYIALASAVLFGGSIPLAKLLLGQIEPWLLAGLLYLGSGLILSVLLILRRLTNSIPAEASLQKPDLLWLAGATLAGGIVAPVLLLIGLTETEASTASLLLNLEALATMGLAWIVYRENVDRRLLIGAAAILTGSILLSWNGGGRIGWGAFAILAACLAWGIDNNLTRKISAADPIQITAIKGSVAGIVNVVIALMVGAKLPSLALLASAGIIGFFGYGLSIVLFVIALRHLGTARTSAYFSTAPFVGAILSVVIFAEPITIKLIGAAILMGIGVWLHVSERHEHPHRHDATEHDHAHLHDEHHRHEHLTGEPVGEPHTHRHKHTAILHHHPHYPDLHHRHSH